MNHWASLVEPASLVVQTVQGVIRSPLDERERAVRDHSQAVAEAPPRVAAKRPRPKPPGPTRQAIDKASEQRFERSFRRELMLMLADGPMDEKSFRAMAGQLFSQRGYRDQFGVAHAMCALITQGLIACDVQLTAKGMEKLGLKGAKE